MPDGGGIREAVSDVARHASAVARLQAELTRSEVRSSGVLGFGAAVCAVMAFLLLTVLIVAALAIPLPLWLAVMIVMLVYVALAAILGVAFRRSRQAGVATKEARITVDALRSARANGSKPAGSSGSTPLASPTPPAPLATPGPAATPATTAPAATPATTGSTPAGDTGSSDAHG